MSDNELGAFLRSRREAVTPAEVGLPDGPRRRTPGLRRAELATLAGVSVEYLTRLEQGRDRRPSPQVLGALADALRLSYDDRVHLRLLAKMSSGDACAAGTVPSRTVRPQVRQLLDRLEPTPAYVTNWLTDVLERTTGFERLAGPLGLLDGDPPNLARYTFGDPRAREAYQDWDAIADQRAATLRLKHAGADQFVAALVGELSITAGAAFTDRLSGPPVAPRRTGVERWNHPDVGELRLSYEHLDLADDGGAQLVIYLPADDATAVALDHLTGRRPGALRVVRGQPAVPTAGGGRAAAG